MNLQQISEKLQRLGKDRFILLFLAGLMLLIIVMPLGTSKADSEQELSKELVGQQSTDEKNGDFAEEDAKTGQGEMEEYRRELCRQLEEFLQTMDGVGQTKVYITMHSSAEIIVERNSPYSKRTEEETTQDSTRVIGETENDSEVVLIDREDGSKAPIIVKEIVPTVRGVVVAAQGADNEMIKNEITALVMALFGIDEHKIRVVKLST